MYKDSVKANYLMVNTVLFYSKEDRHNDLIHYTFLSFHLNSNNGRLNVFTCIGTIDLLLYFILPPLKLFEWFFT